MKMEVPMKMKVNQKAPDFELRDQHGTSFRLSENLGRRLLLVFYPGDDTSVCTRQLCEYRDHVEEFTGLGVEVVGISRDAAESHRRFRDRYDLPFTLLSDPDLAVAGLYGCHGMLGMKRGVFLVDEDGMVRYAHVETVALFKRGADELIGAIGKL